MDLNGVRDYSLSTLLVVSSTVVTFIQAIREQTYRSNRLGLRRSKFEMNQQLGILLSISRTLLVKQGKCNTKHVTNENSLSIKGSKNTIESGKGKKSRKILDQQQQKIT